MTRRKTFTISNDMELLWDSGVYIDLVRRIGELAPLTDRDGKPLDAWQAKKRRKIVRATVDGISITRSIHRDAGSWTVYWQSQIKCDHFTASLEESAAWDHDPNKPLVDKSEDYDEASIWDEAAGPNYGLSLSGCVGHFLNFVGSVDRKTAHAIIARCEKDGSIDAQDAMMARLALK